MFLLFGLFVFGFLVIFQPFHLTKLSGKLIFVALGFGLTTFMVVGLMNAVFLPIFPKFFSEEKWTVGRELLWSMINTVVVGLGNAFYVVWIGIGHWSFQMIFSIELYTLAIGVFPIGISVLLKEARLKKRFERGSSQINTGLENRRTTAPVNSRVEEDDSLLILPSDNRNEQFSLRYKDLIYVRSSDNYVEVYYMHEDRVTKKILRNSLKTIVETLSAHSQFFRCHKSYLVNLDKIERVSGNAQGYKLHLADLNSQIPVSRKYNAVIKKRLADHP